MLEVVQRLANILQKFGNQFDSTIGLGGLIAVADTTNRTKLNAFAIKAVEDTVIATITIDNSEGTSGALSGKTIIAGDTIVGLISQLQLTSGTVLIYKRVF